MTLSQTRQRQHRAGVIKSKCLGGQANPTSRAESEQRRLDFERERRIDRLRLELLSLTSPDTRRAAWSALRDETATRLLAQIRRMEVARGLRE